MTAKKQTTNAAVITGTTTTKDFGKFVDSQATQVTESVLRTPVFNFGVKNPIAIEYSFNEVAAYVGDPNKVATPVANAKDCTELMTALDNLRRGIQFPVVKPGLHLRIPLENIKDVQLHRNIGVLGESYVPEGPTDRFAKLVPAEGWVRLGRRWGTTTAYPITYKEYVEGEDQEAAHDRNSIALHGAMEALLTGGSFHLCPVFWKNDVALSGEALRASRLAWVADWQRILASTDDEAAESYRKNVLQKQTRIAGGKIFSRIQNGIEPVMTDEEKAIATVPARGGGSYTLTDLLGKRIQKWHGEKGEISIIHTVSLENWQWLVDICAERNLNVQILEQ
jgi:hypothetical protein